MNTNQTQAAAAVIPVPMPTEGLTVRQCINSGITFLRKVYRTKDNALVLSFAQAWAPRTAPERTGSGLNPHKAKGVGGKPVTFSWFAEGFDDDGGSMEEKALAHLESLGIDEDYSVVDKDGGYAMEEVAVTAFAVFDQNLAIHYQETTVVEADKDGNIRAKSPFTGNLAGSSKKALSREDQHGNDILLTHEGEAIYSFTKLSDEENVLGQRVRLTRDQDQTINLPVQDPATPQPRRRAVPA